MSQENKIDFTKSPDNTFYILLEEHGELGPLGIFEHLFTETDYDFERIVLVIVTIAYMRINATNADNQFHIPAGASIDNLKYIDKQNFFKELFVRFKAICNANERLGDAATILEPYFMEGADKLTRSDYAGRERELIDIDWSESGIGKRDYCLYVRDELMWSWFGGFDYRISDFTKELHHLVSLLNIHPEEKVLCSPGLYITYLATLFEQLGWETNDCETLANTYLNKVTAIQVDPVLWAIQTLQVVIFGCDKMLISNASGLLAMQYSVVREVVEVRFDVIFLPELSTNEPLQYLSYPRGDLVLTVTKRGNKRCNKLIYMPQHQTLLNA